MKKGKYLWEGSEVYLNGTFLIVLVISAFLLTSLGSPAFADTEIEGFGQRVSKSAQAILQPIGAVVAIYNGWQAFQNEHGRGKHIAAAIGGGLVALWDKTVEFVKYLIGGGG
jgi:hypothetical protein